MSDDEFQNEYLTFTPCIAVNKDGVVAVAWYDRRGLPKSRREPMKGAGVPAGAFDIVREGWSFRVRISVDGGGSWLPSVQVNEETGRGDLNVGHTAGLASDADGRFHAVWVDNRMGNNKLWTASIAVKGRDRE